MLCPQCDSLLVQRTPPANLLDRLSSVFAFYPFQCQSCKYWFRARVSESEHRRNDRISIQIPVSFEWGEGRGEGTVTDISAGGCALESKRRLRPGLLLRLNLPSGMEGTADRTVQQLVTVRSVNGDRAGVQFLAFTPQEQHQLTQTITRCVTRARR
jgi:hypothetical protein